MRKTGRDIPCLQCGKEFYLPAWRKKPSGNYCSRDCKDKSLLKPRVEVVCRQCGEKFLARQYEIDRGRGTVCSKKCSILVWVKAGSNKITQLDETKQSRWKGDRVGYYGVHDWMTKHFGQPIGCEVCGSTNPERTYCWANLSQQYKRDRNDFKRMCMSCHRKYDDAGRKAAETARINSYHKLFSV